MKLVEVRVIEVNRVTNILTLLEDFINSGTEVAIVKGYDYKDARVCVAAINRDIKKYDLFDIVEVFRRKDKVYLARID